MVNCKEQTSFFFIGIAGSGMSALAQFLALKGKKVAGSDRIFINQPNHITAEKLKKLGIKLYKQGEAHIEKDAVVCVSTAIEENVPEIILAKSQKNKIIHRSELWAEIIQNHKTVAIAGTSGKSTTTAMTFHILKENGKSPSLLSGAALQELKSDKLLGNAWVGESNILVVEADESDGTIVKYKPDTGAILNIDIDHKDLQTLNSLFAQFAQNSSKLVCYDQLSISRTISNKKIYKFGFSDAADFKIENIKEIDQQLHFKLNNTDFILKTLGTFNALNAAAATAAVHTFGISIKQAAQALKTFRGIERRMEIIEQTADFTLIDDYAHNPAKLQAAIESLQTKTNRLIIWFQPHGFAPMRLWGKDLAQMLANTLRNNDTVILNEIYYAGGNVKKDVSSKDFVEQIKKAGKKALYLEDRQNLANLLMKLVEKGSIVLMAGARDHTLHDFAQTVANQLKKYYNG